MSRRVSHSVLDPYIGPRLKSLYPLLRIPDRFPPEGIVLVGHLSAIVGAIGFAFSTQYWWGGLVAAIGVVGNHTADCVDGTHARATGQCRNGGELLDHFTDPLSFAYYLIGIAFGCQSLGLGLIAVSCLFCFAVLTNIKAKMLGEFTLSRFGPTEFKTFLALFGCTLSLGTTTWLGIPFAMPFAFWTFVAMIGLGVTGLIVQLITSVHEVNQHGTIADTSEWVVKEEK